MSLNCYVLNVMLDLCHYENTDYPITCKIFNYLTKKFYPLENINNHIDNFIEISSDEAVILTTKIYESYVGHLLTERNMTWINLFENSEHYLKPSQSNIHLWLNYIYLKLGLADFPHEIAIKYLCLLKDVLDSKGQFNILFTILEKINTLQSIKKFWAVCTENNYLNEKNIILLILKDKEYNEERFSINNYDHQLWDVFANGYIYKVYKFNSTQSSYIPIPHSLAEQRNFLIKLHNTMVDSIIIELFKDKRFTCLSNIEFMKILKWKLANILSGVLASWS